jgi:acetyl esterase/lipase
MRALSRIALLLPLAALVAACSSPLRALNALTPRGGFERTEGIAYGDDPRQRLDIYRPEGLKAPAPVVVFFYGGAWKGGERSSYLFAAQALASRGMVVVVPDYRVFPQVKRRGFMDDAAAAVAWTRREASKLGGDPQRLFVMGHSAGAHIAALLAYDERYLKARGLDRSALGGFVGIAGPYAFEPRNPEERALIADDGSFDDGLPVTYVRGGEPPSMLVTGEGDTTVSPRNTEKLVAKLRSVGSPVTDRRTPYNHYTILGRLSATFRDDVLLDDIAAFVAQPRGQAPLR